MPGGRRKPRDVILRTRGWERLREARGAPADRTGLSRRQFLKTGGLAGIGLLMPGCTRSRTARESTGESSGPAIAVVGAGLAGLTVAHLLRAAGLGCTVFEASGRVGGRCWSARDFAGGQIGEHGGEFIDTRHVHMRALADDLGLELDDTWAAWSPASKSFQVVEGEVEQVIEEFDWMTPAIERLFELSALGPLGRGEGPDRLVELDQMTAEDWYRSEVGPIDDPWYRLWSTDMSAWFGLDPDQLGAGNLLDFYTFDYNGADERWVVGGGNDQIPDLIMTSLPPGTIRLESPVEAISANDTKVSLIHTGEGGPQEFDFVVLAVPFTTLREMDLGSAGFSETTHRAIEQLAMGTNSKLLMQFNRPFFAGFDDWSGSLVNADDPAFSTWESGSTDGNDDLGLLTVFTGGRSGASYDPAEAHSPAPETAVSATLDILELAVADAAAAFTGTAWLDSWVDDQWARGSYAAFGPGQTTAFWGLLGARQGRIHIAGEHTSVFSQGFLNGAVESGFRVAKEILDAVGLPRPKIMDDVFAAAEGYQPEVPFGQ